ncbi:MAG TPA: copper amine oxidase [Clostridiales bacterium]|nr:copper amine oxidase [Clostridiales bacterium]
MSKFLKLNKKIALICVVLLATCLFSGFTAAKGEHEVSYTEIPIYVDGILMLKGYKAEYTTFVPLRAFSQVLDRDLNIRWDQPSKTAFVETDEFVLSAKEGDNYITANGRYFYVPSGVINNGGTILVPIREIAKAFNVEVNWNSKHWTIDIDTSEMSFIESGEEVYNEEDVYWLSRIINAESLNQPLEGKIAVGNVVLNRVADETCPDTIYDVIFDRKYGVQFSVITNGTIYMDPSEESIIAAKICLEGYSVVGDSIYFVNPDIGVSSWFVNTRTFVKSIGNHDFYA